MTVDLDLPTAIEAAARARFEREVAASGSNAVAHWTKQKAAIRAYYRRQVASAVRDAAPLIAEQARREPFNWRPVGWMDQHGTLVACHEGDCTGDDGAVIWRRVYVMLTAEERAAIHGVQVGELP